MEVLWRTCSRGMRTSRDCWRPVWRIRRNMSRNWSGCSMRRRRSLGRTSIRRRRPFGSWGSGLICLPIVFRICRSNLKKGKRLMISILRTWSMTISSKIRNLETDWLRLRPNWKIRSWLWNRASKTLRSKSQWWNSSWSSMKSKWKSRKSSWRKIRKGRTLWFRLCRMSRLVLLKT